MDDFISFLEHSNRIRYINLIRPFLTAFQIERAAMQVPFPELTALRLDLRPLPSDSVPVVPDSFLGGSADSAPRLRLLTFIGTPLPDFWDGKNYFYLPLTSSNFTFGVFLIPGISHLRQWSLSSPCCLASMHFTLDLNLVNLALTGEADDRLY